LQLVFRTYVLAPDGGEPEGGVPDGGVPEGGVPDGAVPPFPMSAGGVPDGCVPFISIPAGGVPDGWVLFICISAGGVPEGWTLFAFVAIAAAWTWLWVATVLLLVVPVSCVHPARNTPAIRIADATRTMVIDFFIGMISIECERTCRLLTKKPAGPLGPICPFFGFTVLAYSG
jgi:hypothetical protein